MRHSKLPILGIACLLAAAISAPAQDKKAPEKKAPEKSAAAGKKMEMPKPGPEVKKLAYFVGTWKSEGEMKENPFMPAGHFTSTDKCEWFEGGFNVVCHSTGKAPMGNMHSLGILAYNSEDKVYTYYGVDNMGFADLSKGTVQGSVWTFSSESKMGGKTHYGRYTMTEESPTAYAFKYEMSEDGKAWSPIMEGKTSKAGAAVKK